MLLCFRLFVELSGFSRDLSPHLTVVSLLCSFSPPAPGVPAPIFPQVVPFAFPCKESRCFTVGDTLFCAEAPAAATGAAAGGNATTTITAAAQVEGSGSVRARSLRRC